MKEVTFVGTCLAVSIMGFLVALSVPFFHKKEVENVRSICFTITNRVESTVINGYEISLAFEYDGVRVYKFYNNIGNRTHYFSKEIR